MFLYSIAVLFRLLKSYIVRNSFEKKKEREREREREKRKREEREKVYGTDPWSREALLKGKDQYG